MMKHIKIYENYHTGFDSEDVNIIKCVSIIIEKLEKFFNEIKEDNHKIIIRGKRDYDWKSNRIYIVSEITQRTKRFLSEIPESEVVIEYLFDFQLEYEYGEYYIGFSSDDEIYMNLEKYLYNYFSSFFKFKGEDIDYSSAFYVDNINRLMINEMEFDADDYNARKEGERFGL